MFECLCFQLLETLTFKPQKEQHHLHSSELGSVSFSLLKSPCGDLHIPCSLGHQFLDIFPALHPSRTLPADISDARAPSALFRLSFFFPVICVSAGAAQGKYFQHSASYVARKARWLKSSFPGQISVIFILLCRKFHL